MDRKKRVFSGIQPTGIIHIGNYLGAIKRWIDLIPKYNCIFSIVDYHAITVMYDPKEFPNKILEAAKVLVASGIDPDKAILFVQSTVPEHTELQWILNSITPIGDLERMTQYKDKKQQNADNINAGLLTYPILMASDILLYKGEVVPVGEDQKQHLELTREIVRRFNKRFGDTFPEPQTLLGVAPRIKGLDGNAKMSKSLNNYIALVEEKDEIWNKLRVAVTDPARKRRTDPGNPDICNIFSFHKYFSSEEEIKKIDNGCRTAEIGCIDCKKILAENINRTITPIRERKRELDSRDNEIRDILYNGTEKAKSIAEKTMDEVRGKIGVKF
ncbi:MAG: tryptophan--tRNA ligase [Spirochaetes bacterium]|nr:MAG: tryptophan--tRNA ligase [Spirochaetota bacterium]